MKLSLEEANELVTTHLKEIRSEAMHFFGKHHDLTIDDLTQAGAIGAIKATRHFDPAKNYRFYTYASWWVRREIKNAIVNGGLNIKVSSHVHEDLSKICVCQLELGEEATVRQIHDMSGIPIRTINTALSAKAIKVDHLQRQVGQQDENGKTLEDRIPDHSSTDAEQRWADEECDREVRESLRILEESDPVAGKILRLQFGINDGREMNMAEIGRQMKLTRERIRQLKNRAIRKFRNIHQSRMKESFV